MKLRQSDIAQEAYDRIESLKTDALRDIREEYKTRANRFPAMVVQSGLAQAMGFLRAKADPKGSSLGRAYARYLEDLVKVAHRGWPALKGDSEAFYRDVTSADLARYRRLTQLVLDASVWMKSLAHTGLRTDSEKA